MKRDIQLVLIILGMCYASPVITQNVVNLANKSEVSIDLNDFTDKLMSGQPVIDSSMWLNYTALVNPTDPGMSITAEIGSGQIPKGIVMYIEAKPIVNSGFQNVGRPTGKVKISQMPKTIVENIKTSYTGSGAEIGHQLIISFELIDFSLIQPGISAVYLQFTLK